ncbi:hypothetical protein [Maritalea sp.]|uniref:hypothetical protein n=1 Tax=Maritalea sp. TaxID=2003361 RepID=UPI003EF3284B
MALDYTISSSDRCDMGHPDFDTNNRPYSDAELDYLQQLDNAVDNAFKRAGLDRKTTPTNNWTKDIRSAMDLFYSESGIS